MTRPDIISPDDPLVAGVRDRALRHPNASEVWSWGRPIYRAGRTTFLMLAASPEMPHSVVYRREEGAAVAGEFDPPYFASRGWKATMIDPTDIDWSLVDRLIDGSYRLTRDRT